MKGMYRCAETKHEWRSMQRNLEQSLAKQCPRSRNLGSLQLPQLADLRSTMEEVNVPQREAGSKIPREDGMDQDILFKNQDANMLLIYGIRSKLLALFQCEQVRASRRHSQKEHALGSEEQGARL